MFLLRKKGLPMKKLGFLLVMLSLTVLTVGCGDKAGDDGGDAPAANGDAGGNDDAGGDDAGGDDAGGDEGGEG